MKNHYLLSLATALLLIFLPASALSQVNYNQPANPVAVSTQIQQGWLGVVLSPLPPALGSHLASLLPAGQGLMVSHVENNSPAALAGIQTYDILLKLDDQKLYSPAQLSSLVSSIIPGNQVALELVRNAGLMTLQVDISPRPDQRMSRPPKRFNRPYPAMPRLPHFSPGFNQRPGPASSWDSFESVKVNTLANGRYHAEVIFKNRNNETKSFIFEGKKEEIIQQIQQQPDLPADKRDALLNALNMRGGAIRGPFNTPFFQDNIFHEPFFQSPFKGYPPAWRQHYYGW